MQKTTDMHSIRFTYSQKNRNVRFDCTGCWRLSAKPPIDGLPQLTQLGLQFYTLDWQSGTYVSPHIYGAASVCRGAGTGQWGTAPPIFCEGARRIHGPQTGRPSPTLPRGPSHGPPPRLRLCVDESNRNYFWRIGML